MKVYTVIYEEYYHTKEVLGVYSTLARAYHEVQACFGPDEKIKDEEMIDDCIVISTNTDTYWIHINTVDE